MVASFRGSSIDLTDAEKQELVQSAVPTFCQKQLRFKWVGCPYHKETSLQVPVIQCGDHKGSLVLRCSNFWKKDDCSQPRCFWTYPFPMKLFHLLPKQTRDEYQDIKHVLLRNMRPRCMSLCWQREKTLQRGPRQHVFVESSCLY